MQELDSVRQELAGHKARLEEIRGDMKVAKDSRNEQRFLELEQREKEIMDYMKELLGYMKQLQAEKNRLGNELAAAAAPTAAGHDNEVAALRVTVQHLRLTAEQERAAAQAQAAEARALAEAMQAEFREQVDNLRIQLEAQLQRRRRLKARCNNEVNKGHTTRLPSIAEDPRML